ncbi:hypothetical protein DLM75_20095 [Leptospira stimsonii]|uniref:Uncharacterized protein n=1 Tax=Leptospira stimsonii TaxID=2202203 RepID=A0A396YRG0_9LEPT|nr:hypothetical protein DLM75_20095 [Leptospira stimsonii]
MSERVPILLLLKNVYPSFYSYRTISPISTKILGRTLIGTIDKARKRMETKFTSSFDPPETDSGWNYSEVFNSSSKIF